MQDFYYLVLAQAAHSTTAATEHASAPSILETIAYSNVINVAIVFIFLGWLINKYNLFSGISQSQKKIIDDLIKAEKSKEDSIKQLKSAEEKLHKAKEDADNIISEAEKIALKIKADIISDAEKEADRIIQQAQKVIKTEQKLAAIEMQNNLTNAALEVAKDNIKSSLDQNWHQKIIQDFVDHLSTVKVK